MPLRLPFLLPALVLASLLLPPAAAAQEAEAVGPRAARALERGAVLAAEDVLRPEGDTAAVDAAPVGWVTRRVIAEGEPLREPAVAPPDLVKPGQMVQLVWDGGPIELRLSGRAMGAAAAGERVLVRVDLRRRFEGVVVGPALVRLNSPEDRSR